MLTCSQALLACQVIYKHSCTRSIINHHANCIIGIISSTSQGRKLRLGEVKELGQSLEASAKIQMQVGLTPKLVFIGSPLSVSWPGAAPLAARLPSRREWHCLHGIVCHLSRRRWGGFLTHVQSGGWMQQVRPYEQKCGGQGSLALWHQAACLLCHSKLWMGDVHSPGEGPDLQELWGWVLW